MRQAWDRMTPRERAMVLVALPLALALMGYQFGWRPVQQDRAALRGEIARSLTIRAAAERAPIAGGRRAATVPEGSAATRVTRSARALGLTLSRIEPEGTGVSVFLEDAGFDEVIGWVAELETGQALRLSAIELDRRPLPGRVAARLTLEPLS